MNVLVVDDELAIRECLALQLERRGAHVTLSQGVLDALGHLQKCCFDLVITDYNLLDGDGGTVAREALFRYPKVKVAVMSGNLDTVPASIARRVHYLFDKPGVFGVLDQLMKGSAEVFAA